ncbi:hypothetical protein AB0C28_49000 [Nonomuraea sp. NPDC048892]|uniref:DUF3885 domain-containing protein n=1 Tax=Nonomuraea sp. NPDC048892 TaxID=3154624 RepID=UPI0033D95BAD
MRPVHPKNKIASHGPDLRRLYHPYDGGADVILTNTQERDTLKAAHTDWLSKHPSGL